MSAGLNRTEACVMCPFYRGAKKGEKKVLKCASPLAGGLENETRFRSEDARKEQERNFCKSGRYPSCQMCMANDAARGFERPRTDERGKRV